MSTGFAFPGFVPAYIRPLQRLSVPGCPIDVNTEVCQNAGHEPMEQDPAVVC